MHTGDKHFRCDKVFNQFESTLQTHKRKHTGDKPNECDVCQL